ncbi:MAG: molybdenum cofactor biosynthesis protein MoaE [Ignisphaera sp.]
MKVKVKLFSLYRDAVGVPELDLVVEKGSSIKYIIEKLVEDYPNLKSVFREINPLVLMNGEVVEEDTAIYRDAEIALAPPASGGTSIRVSLFSDDISIDRLVEEMVSDKVGAIAVFIGVVKGDVDNHKVYELVYEVYEPYVTKVLERIAEEELTKYGLHAVQIHHRAGVARRGQKTVVIAVSASSRREAFEALHEILERVKFKAPIYKLERRDDGEYWVIGDGKRIRRIKSE